MRRLMSLLMIVLVMALLVSSFAGCVTMDTAEGIEALMSAYENTRDNYSDIYQYSEKRYLKATPEKAGGIDNITVNVNCAIDRDYHYIKDKDYAISVYQNRYIETMDETMKATNKFVGSNSIRVGEIREGEHNLYATINSIVMKDGKEESLTKKYRQKGIEAKTFYDEEYLAGIQLMNTQAMQEIGMLKSEDMDFDIKDGGIEKKGRTTDYKFAVREDYLKKYRETYGRDSILGGKYVWIQTSYNRISNLYVYKDEVLGSGLTAEYESYVFMVTYLGKHVEFVSPTENETDYIDNIIYTNGAFSEGILSPLRVVK